MDTLLAESVERFLAGCSTLAVVREVERSPAAASEQARSFSAAASDQEPGRAAAAGEQGRSRAAAALWAEVEASGYADLLVGEAAGGAGLGLSEAFAVWLACGRHALPLPLAATMWVRAVLSRAGVEAPAGPLALASQCSRTADGAIACQGVPFGALADWVLVADAQGSVLLPVAAAERRDSGVHGSLQAGFIWPARVAGARLLPAGHDGLAAGALITATLMAGALQRVLEATVRYANERAQFGKAIGKFQAVQQQLAVMAEQVFAARIAAEAGCAEGTEPQWLRTEGSVPQRLRAEGIEPQRLRAADIEPQRLRAEGIEPRRLRAAVAKARASEAAEKVVAIAHAVHGAIGVTAEYDLQLYTRRLQEWRGDYGSQAYWHGQLGQALLDAPQANTLQFLLDELVPR